MILARVLIIDDSEAVLAHGRAVLGGRFSVTTAKNGAEGIARARSIRPDASSIPRGATCRPSAARLTRTSRALVASWPRLGPLPDAA
jgi:hypothetical protein